LSGISRKMYGSGSKYMKIFEANTPFLEDPNKIFPGQELVIPDLGEE
jgi:nucleoid-associated protein YgaU